MQKILTCCTIISLGIASSACGADNNHSKKPSQAPTPPAQVAAIVNTPTTAAASTVKPAKKPEAKAIMYCPETKKLVKKGLFWSAPNGWRSYAQSFVRKVDTFVGAQWVGIKVGKMLCLYRGSENLTFPVILQSDALTIAPERARLPNSPKYSQWGRYESGYVNCNSVDVYDCPFERKSKKLDMEEVYDEIDFFKE